MRVVVTGELRNASAERRALMMEELRSVHTTISVTLAWLRVFGSHPAIPGFVLLVRVRYNLIPNRYLYNSGCHGMSNSGSPMSIYNSGSPMSIYNSGPMSR